jgi:membrane associated rhomboid family serine protease
VLLPYNVDRPTKRAPIVTYTLIGLNVFIFLMTLLVSNTYLPSDRIQGRELIHQLLKDEATPTPPPGLTAPGTSDDEGEGEGESGTENISGRLIKGQAIPDPAVRGQAVGTDSGDGKVTSDEQGRAFHKIENKVGTPDGYRQLYLIQHVNDKFVLVPHYTVMNLFAYRPAEPAPILKLVALFTSMFLHGGIMHILGNMLFLWVFGRALEEFLGYRFYTAIYLTCGVAATLMFHIITTTFSPESAGLPLVGASGAIAGVLGLFAIRFYRTKVRVFYIALPLIIAIPVIGPIIALVLLLAFLLLLFLAYLLVASFVPALIIASIIFFGLLFVFGRTWAWGAFRAPSMWVIGVYIVAFNVLPALKDIMNHSHSSTAYWAHLGGFACGALYAFVVGGIEEGKSEYELEDAQAALQKTGSGDALDRAMRILEKDQENTPANEVAALAYHQMNNIEAAAPHFIKAINGYSRQGDRPNAMRLYSVASDKNPALALSAPILAGLAAEYAKNQAWNESAALLVRVIEEFPQSTEAEVALLRAAQIWLRQYDDPSESIRMLEMFMTNYPASTYITQAQTALDTARKAAQAQMMRLQEDGQQY